MAKKDRKETEDEYEFVPPDFDEDAFIHKEMVSFRTTLVLFLWGIIAALVSWGLFAAFSQAGRTGFALGLAVMLAFGMALKKIFPALRIDIGHWGRKEWFGTGALYFFTWLAFFVIFLNPPVSDNAAPHIEVFVSPEAQTAGDPVTLDLFYTDNHRVSDLAFELRDDGGPTHTLEDLEDLGEGHYRLELPGLEAGSYQVVASAQDPHGLRNETTVPFVVGDVAVQVDRPADGVLDSNNDEFFVEVPDDVDIHAVYLELERTCPAADGAEVPCRVHLQRDELGWIARRTHSGWEEGNNTFDVVVEQKNRFSLGGRLVEGGEIRSGPHELVVQSPVEDVDPSPRPNPTDAPPRSIPGIPAVLVALALLGAAALRRRPSRL